MHDMGLILKSALGQSFDEEQALSGAMIELARTLAVER